MSTTNISMPLTAPIDKRKQEEMEFHDQREIDRHQMSREEFEKKYSNKKWYSIVQKSRQYIDRWLATNCQDTVALDYCCGLGGMSLALAQNGAHVHGIDISSESVQTASGRLAKSGFSDSSNFQVMDAENLTFDNNTFDVIICSGVLHHLDLGKAYAQLSRVLKPDGKILCIEAVGHNPLIWAYRKLTPHLRTSWEVDHILKMKDLRYAKRFFDAVDVEFFHLFSIAAIPFRKTPLFKPALATLDLVDSLALKVPVLRTMAWQMVFELSRPKVSG